MLSSCLSRSGLKGLPGYLKTIMSERLISRCGRSRKVGPGAKINLLTSRWSPTVMVFSIEAVGTFTAWTIKVIPNKAMITVTTADSKYSRMTVLGGPSGSASTSTSRSRPLGLTDRAVKGAGFSEVFFSVVVTGSLIRFIVDGAPQTVKLVLLNFLAFHLL